MMSVSDIKGKFICHKDFEDAKPINVFGKDLKSPNSEPKYLDRHILFRKTFTLDSFGSVKIRVTADDYYKLYINGVYVTQGPLSGYPDSYYFNEIDVTGFLKKGKNIIAAHTYYQGLVNRVWVSGDMREMFWLELYKDEQLVIVSDETFKCCVHTGFGKRSVFGYDTQFAETFDSSAREVGFEKPDFDDSYWEQASIYKNADYHLIKSSTKQLCEYSAKPKVVERRCNSIFVDFGREMVGYLMLKAKGSSGDVVYVKYGEELNEDGSVRYNLRCNCDYKDEWKLTEGVSEFSGFDYKAFRYAEIDLPKNVELTHVVMNVRHYPFTQTVKYDVDEKLRKIIELCADTVKYGTQDRFIDCPTREKGQYLGDLAISGRAQVILTGDTVLLKNSLKDFCRSTFIDGGMMALTTCSFNQEVADYSLLFAALILWVYKFDNDIEFLRWAEPYATGIYKYFSENKRPDGLIADFTRKWNLVDWPANLRDGYDFVLDPVESTGKGAHNVLNAFWIGQIVALKEIYSILGKPFKEDESALKKSFYKTFFNENTGLYCDNELKTHSAVHSNILPLLFDIGTEDERIKGNLIDFIVCKKLTSMGVYMAYFTLAALIKNGRKDLAVELVEDEGAWLNMIKEGATTTFEAWGKEQKWNTSLFHPWAVAPLIIFSDKRIY